MLRTHYKGHGLPLDQFTQYTVHDWWNDVLNGYQYLKDEGYETIYATGYHWADYSH